ncbi:Arc family DNA-binding protein [Pantoea sp. 1.19]|uniref:Arc family DNA-binding protein n=1 Tax=Pantoea sp. 1.19 TaxID=1925589 RepID=UPI000948CC7A|nr:Arc family DNA-binding protein [Pantoea sp. 1.19]
MSREDPQFRIRLPIELKEKIELSAKTNNRSMNSEIVQRLDVSFVEEISSDKLISALDVIKIASEATGRLSTIIFKRTFEEINRKARIGHKSFSITLDDLELDGLSEDDFVSVFEPTFNKLKELGYEIPDSTWDVTGFLVVVP